MSQDPRERWRRVSALFDRAVELPAGARGDLLARECAGDPALRAEIERMLAADTGDCALDLGAAALAQAHDADAADAGDDDDDATLHARVGSHLGSWRLERLLGRGGMGEVFAATRDDGGTRQRAAVKQLRRRWDGSDQARRFLQERRILAQLSHPNIPALIDHGLDHDGRPWFALEYVDGPDLVAFADARRLGLAARVGLFLQVCSAVQHAHERFVVHRDLKPANILVDGGGRVRVLDFGVAKRLDDGDGATRTGLLAGFSPEYAAPEQVSGGTITAATDVHALGVVLYQLLAGQLPHAFARDDLHGATEAITRRSADRLDRALASGRPEDVRARIVERDTTVAAFRRFVRGDLTRIVQTALAKEPARRYPSVQAFAADLRRLLDGRTVSVSGDTIGYRTRKFVQRNRWSVAMGACAALALLGATAFSTWQAGRARAEAAVAMQMKDYLIEMIRQLDLHASTSREAALHSLAAASLRLQTLRPGSRERLELLAVLLDLYSQRALPVPGLALAARELDGPPRWRRDAGNPARLRAYASALRLHKETGASAQVRDALLPALAGYPHPGDLAHAEALTLLGEVHADLQQLRLSLDCHLRAVAALERVLARDDPRLQYARVLAAGALTTQRRGGEGRAMTERALADLRAGDGPQPAYVRTMAALRRALFGEFASAQSLMEASAAMLDRLGHVRLRGYYVATRSANAYALGRLDTALRELDAQIVVERTATGTKEVYLGWLLLVRGDTQLALGNAAAAAADYSEAADLAAADTPREALYARALAVVALVEAGAVDDARARLPERTGAAPSHATAMALAAAARVADAEGRSGEAARGYAAALADLQAAAAEPVDVHIQLREHRDRIRLLGWQAQATARAGDPGAALPLLHAARREGLQSLGAAHPVVRALDGDDRWRRVGGSLVAH